MTIAFVYIGLVTPVMVNAWQDTTFEPNTLRIAISDEIKGIQGDTQTQIWNLLDKYGLSLQEKIKAVSIINCESRFRVDDFNPNSDDFGIWQINYNSHIKNGDTTITCAMDLHCSTEFAMKLYKQDKNWHQWNCDKLTK